MWCSWSCGCCCRSHQDRASVKETQTIQEVSREETPNLIWNILRLKHFYLTLWPTQVAAFLTVVVFCFNIDRNPGVFAVWSASPPFTHSLPPLRFTGRSVAVPPYCSGTAEERERESGWASERWSVAWYGWCGASLS